MADCSTGHHQYMRRYQQHSVSHFGDIDHGGSEDLATANAPRSAYLSQFPRPTSPLALSARISNIDGTDEYTFATNSERPQLHGSSHGQSANSDQNLHCAANRGTTRSAPSEYSGSGPTATTVEPASTVTTNDPDSDKAADLTIGRLPDGVQARPREFWTPIWLRKRTLSALAALFASLAAALVVLWTANEAQNGFAPSLSTNHYAWTYGPTAILVVVLSFWRQVDYHCKTMQPWQELHKGCADAQRSVLLDYLSPIHITSLIRAVRYRHTPVIASIAGFVILKIVVLVSTGLLVLTPVSITEQHQVALTTEFDGHHFWDNVIGNSYGPRNVSGFQLAGWTESPYLNVSKLPVHAYINSLKEGSTSIVDMLGSIVF